MYDNMISTVEWNILDSFKQSMKVGNHVPVYSDAKTDGLKKMVGD